MSGEKIKVNYIDDNIAREKAFVKGKAEIFEHVGALAREHNAKVVVLLKRIKDPSVSAKQTRILQARLHRSLEELKHEKERNKVIKERLILFYQKHNFKKIEDLSMEDLLYVKTKLEDIRENVNQQREKLLALMSLSHNENDKK